VSNSNQSASAKSIHQSRFTNHFAQLCDIVAKLRSPEGCPWDREQTNASLVSPLLEEAYEVAGAVYAQNDANLREELGDLLLLIIMHAQIASEEQRFDLDEIAREISEKLIRRHPHVFGKSEARGSEAVVRQWEAIKREETGKRGSRPAMGSDQAGREERRCALPRQFADGTTRVDACRESAEESGPRQF